MESGHRPAKPPTAPCKAKGGDEGPISGQFGRTDLRFQYLYEISTLLTRFDGAERTVRAVLGLVARALSLRTALVLLDAKDGSRTETIVWRSDEVSTDQLDAAIAHAQALYTYFTHAQATPRLPGQPHEIGNLIFLPLVVARQTIFGAFQLEGTGPLDEPDLMFVNAVVNQLAIALDRQAAIDAKQAAMEAKHDMALAAEQTARDQLEFTHAVTSSLGEGVLAIDRNGRVTFFNPAAERLLGWTAAEVLGRRVQEVVHMRRTDGSSVPNAERPSQQALLTGQHVHSDDYLFSRPGRAPFDVSCTSTPLKRAGQIVGAVLVFQDIMQVKRTARAQRLFAEVSAFLGSSLNYAETCEALTRLSVPDLADAHFVDLLDEERIAPARRMPRFDAERGHETPQGSVMRTGKSLLLTGVEPDPTTAKDDQDQRDRGRARGSVSMMVVPLHGRMRTLGALTFVALKSGRRYTSSDLAVAEEVARRAAMALENARLYEQSQWAVRVRDDFLAIVSHDLKNSLSTIMVAASLFMHAPAPREQGAPDRRKIEIIFRAAKRMLRLIGDLLDVAAIEAGRVSLETRVHPVDALLRDAVEMEQTLAAEKLIALTSEIGSEESFDVLCDRERVFQVFANLIGNAVKFTASEGTINVRAEPRHHEAVFTVKDSGPGIQADQIPHLFDRFWQADETARMGNGLGLTIAKGLVEAQGGRIWVESRVGMGTTFFFTLPLA